MQIKSICGEVLFTSEQETIADSIEDARQFGANLSGADLYRASLSGADLSGASLSGASLYGADL